MLVLNHFHRVVPSPMNCGTRSFRYYSVRSCFRMSFWGYEPQFLAVGRLASCPLEIEDDSDIDVAAVSPYWCLTKNKVSRFGKGKGREGEVVRAVRDCNYVKLGTYCC